MKKNNSSFIIHHSSLENVPELRFPEFDGEWMEKKLGEICLVERGKFTPRPRNNPIYYNGEIPFVQTGDVVHSNGIIHTHSQTLNEKGLKVSKLFKKGDLLITIAANIGYAGVLQYDMACPDSLIGLKCKDSLCNLFLNYLLKIEQPKMNYLAVAAAQKNINIGFLKPYKFKLPSLPEQTKIADFLTAVDKRISLLQKKKEKLKQYKKGIMQQLFDVKDNGRPSLRFKDDNGNDFPDWEKKKLGEVFDSVKGQGLSKDKISSEGVNECILYGELYTTYTEVVDNVKSKTNANEGIKSRNGDLLVPCSTTTTGIDLANVTALNKDNILLGGDITILRTNKKIDSIFFAYYLSNYKKNEIARYGQGTTIVHLYYSHFKIMNIEIPCYKEQQKIAKFLLSINKSIEIVENQIKQSQQWKKGLLQKMFA